MELELFKNKIFEVRGQKVMLDCDVAEALGVETKNLNTNAKLSPRWDGMREERMEGSYRFKLSKDEFDAVRIGLDNQARYARSHDDYTPWVYTKKGCALLGTSLESKEATLLALDLVDVFVAVQENKLLDSNGKIIQTLKFKSEKDAMAYSILETRLKMARLLGNDESHARTYAVHYTAVEVPEFKFDGLLTQNKSENVDYLTTITTIAKSLEPKVPRNEMNPILEKLGLQYKHEITEKWTPTQLAIDLNMISIVPQTVGKNKNVENLRWFYNKTLDYLVEKGGFIKAIPKK